MAQTTFDYWRNNNATTTTATGSATTVTTKAKLHSLQAAQTEAGGRRQAVKHNFYSIDCSPLTILHTFASPLLTPCTLSLSFSHHICSPIGSNKQKVSSLAATTGRLCHALIKFDLNCIKCVCTHTCVRCMYRHVSVCVCVCCGVQHRFRRLCNSYCLKLDFVTQPTCLPLLAHLLTFTMAKKTNGTELPKPLCLFIGLIENVVQSALNRFPNWFPSIDMFIGENDCN